MKHFNVLFLSLWMIGFFVSCTKQETELDTSPSIKQELQSTFLENGNELLTYPNGVVVEKTPEGEIIWGGDIIINENQLAILTEPETRAGVVRDLALLWTDGIVYYCWDENIMSHAKDAIQRAMKHIEAHCNISFKRKPLISKNWVRFVLDPNENSSYLGRQGGEQVIRLTNTGNRHIAIHEICHALGMIHEHQRGDRDLFVVVDMKKIRPAWQQWFSIFKGGHNTYGTGLKPFDFNSIMIYGCCEEGIALTSGVPYMWKKSDGSTWNDDATELSDIDKMTLNIIYSKPHHEISCKSQCSFSGIVGGGGRFLKGKSCCIFALPSNRREFLGWFDGETKVSSAANWTFIVNESKEYEARYAYPTDVFVEITVSKDIFGKDQGSTNSGYFQTLTGNSVDVTATSYFGYLFSHWKDVDSGEIVGTNRTIHVSCKRDIRLMAVFERGMI